MMDYELLVENVYFIVKKNATKLSEKTSKTKQRLDYEKLNLSSRFAACS